MQRGATALRSRAKLPPKRPTDFAVFGGEYTPPAAEAHHQTDRRFMVWCFVTKPSALRFYRPEFPQPGAACAGRSLRNPRAAAETTNAALLAAQRFDRIYPCCPSGRQQRGHECYAQQYQRHCGESQRIRGYGCVEHLLNQVDQEVAPTIPSTIPMETSARLWRITRAITPDRPPRAPFESRSFGCAAQRRRTSHHRVRLPRGAGRDRQRHREAVCDQESLPARR
jgi:hypothetical protein